MWCQKVQSTVGWFRGRNDMAEEGCSSQGSPNIERVRWERARKEEQEEKEKRKRKKKRERKNSALQYHT